METVSKRIAHIGLTKRLLEELLKNLGDKRASGKTKDYVWFELLGSESHEDFEEFFQSYPIQDGISTTEITQTKGSVEIRKFTGLTIFFEDEEGNLTSNKDIFSMLREFPKFKSIIELKKISKRTEERMEEKLPSRVEQGFKDAM